ncbi:hypothetical protein Pmani_019447 [Petrolisthes manimaculis]|uniref:Uncharacterized protein n=1 Tax=Petrolisthes manimaculis TaxID=1843537 RepID=A0AAE1PKS2_9EUCA|nr:hypothetical protein Pmani_019447 [Petrolisthes manimaculis]
MCRHANLSASALKNKEHTKLASVRTWVRGALVLMLLLGLTWTFGLLYLNQATVGMAYAFTILNSLQGLFIFIFHCVQNDKVRKELRRAGRRHPWLRACLCAAADRSQQTASKDTHNAASHSQPNSHASHTVGTSSSTSTTSCDTHACPNVQNSSNPHAHPITYLQLPANLSPITNHLSQVDPNTLDENTLPAALALNAALNLQVYPSSSSCDSTSSSTTSPPDYQNALPFHIQQLNAAQIYSSPPPTPTLSQLYDTAGPTIATTALHHYIQPRPNALSGLNPHLLTQQQTVSALSLNPTVLQAALSSLHSNNPKALQAVDHHHYHNLLQLPLAAVHLTHDDSNYLQPKSQLAASSSIATTSLQQQHSPQPPATTSYDPPPPPPPHTPNIKNTHHPPPPATNIVLHPSRQSLREGQPHQIPASTHTSTSTTLTPSTPKTRVPPRKPEKPQKNNINNGVKGIFVSVSPPGSKCKYSIDPARTPLPWLSLQDLQYLSHGQSCKGTKLL